MWRFLNNNQETKTYDSEEKSKILETEIKILSREFQT